MKRPITTKSILILAILSLSSFCLLKREAAAKTNPHALVISHNISITVSITGRSLRGSDTIKVESSGGILRLILNKKASITRVRAGGKRVHLTSKDVKDEPLKELILSIPPRKDNKAISVHISFNETTASIKSAEQNIRRGISYVNKGVIGKRGLFLPSSSYWYPHTESGTSQYNLSINMPRGYTSVSEGEWMLHMNSADRTFDRWKTRRPINGLDIVASKFRVNKSVHKGVKIYTFFLKKDKKLSETYRKKSGDYLDLYSGLFGKYPFTKFAVVESFLPTGYGMPSFTLLGSTVLRLPFIPDTSLGHEIAHSWWGNSVFIDSSLGNWSEALTTYTADYRYEAKKGEKEAREFRFKKLEGYRNFAGDKAPSLSKFIYGTEPAERAVGYNKGTMVFAMLEDLLGSEIFNKALRIFYRKNAFRSATWGDIQEAFNEASERDLTEFFKEWLTRAGGPKLNFTGVSTEKTETGYLTSFKVTQDKAPYTMTLPVRLTTADDKVINKNFEIKKTSTPLSITSAERPTQLELDPEYRLFRILSAEELPPSLSVVLGDKEALIVLSSDKAARSKFAAGAELLTKDFGLKIGDIKAGELKKTLNKKSLLILTSRGMADILKGLGIGLPTGISIDEKSLHVAENIYDVKDTAFALALKHSSKEGRNLVIFQSSAATSKKTLKEIKKLRYYTKYSYIILQQGKVIAKGIIPAKKTLSYSFKKK